MPQRDNAGMSDRVSITIDNGIADVRLTRADKRNALDSEMFRAIAEAGERLKTEPGVRCVVLSGEGKSFCAGLDMGSMQQLAGAPPADGEEQTNAGDIDNDQITHLAQQICWVWQELPMPVISAVHGHALGGGIQLALGTDIRFVHPETKMSVRETYWGIVPDMTGTFMLSKLVRPDIAKELTFTARIFSGTEAHAMGLATHLTETPYDDAMALAAEIAGISPSAVRASKELINNMAVDGAAEQFAEERRLIKTQIGTPNQIESVMASFENRSPKFVDV
ncbi:MAG: enoyl-CoA hydratase/carnithine racemase [Ilumatobacter sp.]|jgi:enoyl-CoA hydratase/carnithine racemase